VVIRVGLIVNPHPDYIVGDDGAILACKTPPSHIGDETCVTCIQMSFPRPAGHAGLAKLVFGTDAAPSALVALPCFTAVLAFLGCDHDVPDDEAPGLAHIRRCVRDSQLWPAALRVWAAARSRPDPLQAGGDVLFRFRGSAIRDGRHKFRSMRVYCEIGDAMGERFGVGRVVVSLK
jgi:hypothetical protein